MPSDLEAHLLDKTSYHLQLLQRRSARQKQELQLATESARKKDEEISLLQRDIDSLQRRFAHFDERFKIQERVLTSFTGLVERVVKMERSLVEKSEKISSTSDEAIAGLRRSITEATQRATKAEDAAASAKKSFESVQTKMTAADQRITNIAQVTTRTDRIMADFDLRLLAQETTSYSGVLVWKIPEYAHHFAEAQANKKLSLYSPPFYTSRHGYKVCARVYLNGDGTGKNTHLSVFFVVMRSEFDALVPWPFRQKVTLTLLDQSPAKRHVSDTFQPDVRSSSFQRPTSEMNIASGCPQLVAIETMTKTAGYIKDNAIFIRVSVDTKGLSID